MMAYTHWPVRTMRGLGGGNPNAVLPRMEQLKPPKYTLFPLAHKTMLGRYIFLSMLRVNLLGIMIRVEARDCKRI